MCVACIKRCFLFFLLFLIPLPSSKVKTFTKQNSYVLQLNWSIPSFSCHGPIIGRFTEFLREHLVYNLKEIPVLLFPRTQTILTRSVNFRHRPPPVPPVSSLITMSSTGISLDSNIDTLMKEKKIIRSKIKRELKSMDSNLRSQEDEAIQRIVLEAPWFKSCKRLCAYISCSALREVDTSKILSQVLSGSSKDGDPQVDKILYVPRVEDKNCHMRMLNISSINDLIANSMNILEPASTDIEGHEREDVMLSKYPVELLLLPGLAFDRRGRRLGRGGGYYDVFLSKYQELAEKKAWKRPLLVALSYSLQIMDDDVIPITPNDVLVDALVSPYGVIPITPAARAWYNS